MAVSGNIQHFPIGDIIQLLHMTRKTGSLYITRDKDECQLVFSDGDIVSANYLNSRVRIGQVMIRAGAVTQAELNWALKIQEHDEDNRRPLVLTLLENSMVEKDAAYRCLETLVEMTIVEILTWKSGSFVFKLCEVENPDGWHFYLTKYRQEVILDAQAVLLESLRIFDEMTHNGTIENRLSIVGFGANGENAMLVDVETYG